jgi:hypothetical protein
VLHATRTKLIQKTALGAGWTVWLDGLVAT